MDANVLMQLYENNKMFEGKKIKFFLDPHEIKKNKYSGLMARDEEVVFGIKKFMEFHMMTDKAFYYTPTGGNYAAGPATRIEFGEILDWRLDEEGNLFINSDRVAFSAPLSKLEKALIESVRNIFKGVTVGNDTEQAVEDAVKRKCADPEAVRQLYINNSFYEGVRMKFYKEPHELTGKEQASYSGVWQDGEQIIFVLSKDMNKHIMTDRAFYYQDKSFTRKRLSFQEIKSCEADLSTGKLAVNDDIIELGIPITGVAHAVIASIENIINGVVGFSTDYESLPQLIFGENTDAGQYHFTRQFQGGISENDIFAAWHTCCKAYRESAEVLEETTICVDEENRKALAERYMNIAHGEALLFKYDAESAGFFITNQRIGMYWGQKQNTSYILLPQVESLTIRSVYGRKYLIINGNESAPIELLRRYSFSCALLFVALSYARGEHSLPVLLSLVEQYKRLGMLQGAQKVTTSLGAERSRLKMLASGSGCDTFEGDTVLWSSGGQLLCITERGLHYSGVINGVKEIKTWPLSDIRSIDIDFMFRQKSDRAKGASAGMLLGGLSGALVGSAIGYDKKTEFSHCELAINGWRQELKDMRIPDAIMLRLLFAAATINNRNTEWLDSICYDYTFCNLL